MKNRVLIKLYCICLISVFLFSCGKKEERIKLVSEYSPETTVNDMETIEFGMYPQNDGNKKEPIEWIVLDRKDNKVLLLSKFILDCRRYNETNEDCTWETSSLRQWLNNDFYNVAFDDEEQNKIVQTNIINSYDSWETKTDGGNDTMDKIFCLSITDCRNYFDLKYSENKRLATKGTDYAKNVNNHGHQLTILNNESYWYHGNSGYWTRTPGHDKKKAKDIRYEGNYDESVFVTCETIGVRPALWIKYK